MFIIITCVNYLKGGNQVTYIINDKKSFYDLCDTLSGKVSFNEKLNRAVSDNDEFIIDLKEPVALETPIIIKKPIHMKGNGVTLNGKTESAFVINSGNVVIHGFIIDKIVRSVIIDALDQKIENILLSDITINDPGYGMGFNIGSSESYGKIINTTIENCTVNSGYDEADSLKTGIFDGAMGFNISAACPAIEREDDIIGAEVDGLYIRNCKVLGPRRYGINLLVGTSIPQPGTDFLSQKSRIIDCAVRNVKVLDCEFDYCREMAVTLSCSCINNYGSVLEYLEIARCRAVYGISGIGFSGAGPFIPTSVARNMGMRHGSMHDNELIMMDLPVNEPSCGIALVAARCEGFAGIEVYDCFVEDVDIYNNTIINADMAFMIACANSMGDEAVSLSDNHISDIRIYNNHIKDARTVFTFMAAYAEGRRFDWNWGWRKNDYRFAELSKDHAPTIKFFGNSISGLDCHDNDINGCANEIVAVAALGRGHALMKDNRICDGISYHDNRFERSEGHINIRGAYYSDWVQDLGGNIVEIKK